MTTTATRTRCYPSGFNGAATLCDECYAYGDKPAGKIRGFVFYFADCFDPPLYFVPCDERGSRDLDLEAALETWIDALYTAKSPDIIGGGYPGSESLEDNAKYWDAEFGNEDAWSHITMGASFYGIDSESWQCKESWIEADAIRDEDYEKES